LLYTLDIVRRLNLVITHWLFVGVGSSILP